METLKWYTLDFCFLHFSHYLFVFYVFNCNFHLYYFYVEWIEFNKKKITGIPEISNPTLVPASQGARPKTPISSYLNSLMKVLQEAGIDSIQAEDIATCQKITISGETDNKHFLLVKMTSEKAKSLLCSQRNKLKTCKQRIYMNEDLIKEDANLFMKAREDIKKGKLHSAWMRNGLVWGKTTETGQCF